VRKQVISQHRNKVGHRPAKARPQLQVLQNQDRDQCCPNLNKQGVWRCAHKSLDLQVLLDGLEKYLDLPPVPVHIGDGRRAKPEMVGKQRDHFTVPGVPDLDHSERMPAFFRIKPDRTIAKYGAVLRDSPLFYYIVNRIAFHSRHKIDTIVGPTGKQAVIPITTVNRHDGAGGKGQVTGHVNLVNKSLGDMGEHGKVAVVIEKQVKLHRALRLAILRPVEKLHAKLDHRRVQAEQLVLEPELFLAVGQQLATIQKLVEHIFV